MIRPTLSGKLTEGKTKIVWRVAEDDLLVLLESMDDITAGDGAKHDIIQGKGRMANGTTCNVFRLLDECNIPLAFLRQVDETSFLAKKCKMVPVEVVIRREAYGSFLRRNPSLERGHIFSQLLVEFFLKTTGREWEEHQLPVDDPLILVEDGKAKLYLPNQPLDEQGKPFLVLNEFPVLNNPEILKSMEKIARNTFLAIEKAWKKLGRRLVDLKIEFGFTEGNNQLVVADVIDNDSWRVIQDGEHIDKEFYRQGGDLKKVAELYQLVYKLTGSFSSSS